MSPFLLKVKFGKTDFGTGWFRYKGMPHAFGAMDGVLDGGRQLIEDVCAAMKVL